MWSFMVGEAIAKIILAMLPRRLSRRIQENTQDMQVFVLRTGTLKTKPKMTLIEGVFATILFDLALFGTSNIFIRSIIRIFTNIQNSWDRPFSSPEIADSEIQEFCHRLSIQQCPWIWEKNRREYKCLNDFFARTYATSYFPPIGEARLVSPACCVLTRFNDDSSMKRILIKGCSYRLEDVGLPSHDLDEYKKNPVILGYLSPTDYHRVHSPVGGKCIYVKLEGQDIRSASVKFWGGKFNILNENKRLVVVIEDTNLQTGQRTRIALVVIGGVGVDTITYDPNIMGRHLKKGEEVSTFRAGGSAVAIFSTSPLHFLPSFNAASENGQPVEVVVGESIGNF